MNNPLPPKPQPPQDYDCCGGGCADCEYKLYLREMAAWKKQCEEIESAQRPSVLVVPER